MIMMPGSSSEIHQWDKMEGAKKSGEIMIIRAIKGKMQVDKMSIQSTKKDSIKVSEMTQDQTNFHKCNQETYREKKIHLWIKEITWISKILESTLFDSKTWEVLVKCLTSITEIVVHNSMDKLGRHITIITQKIGKWVVTCTEKIIMTLSKILEWVEEDAMILIMKMTLITMTSKMISLSLFMRHSSKITLCKRTQLRSRNNPTKSDQF